MSLNRYFPILIILFVGLGRSIHADSLDSLLNSKPLKFSLTPEVVFKSPDKINPDFPNKILLSNDTKSLYFLGKKGLYTLNLANN